MSDLQIYIDGLVSQKTKTEYKRNIENMLKYLNKEVVNITYKDLYGWKSSLNQLSSSSQAVAVASVKGYFNFLEETEVITANPATKLKAPKINNKPKVPLNKIELRELIENTKNIRDKAIITLMASTTMRISELINLKLSDLDKDNITIQGKGNKYRVININDEIKGYIDEYLKVRKQGINNLFVGNQGNPMGIKNVSQMIKTTAKRAGINDPERLSNHYLRATGATILAQDNVPIQVIQKIMGHSDISTTEIYVKTSQEQIKQAMTVCHF